jgi:DNA-binding NarL/FixJ family response regulator
MTSIVIADPDSRTRQALALLLERRLSGVQCVGEAWDRTSLEGELLARRPDLLLLDRYLPDLSTPQIEALTRCAANPGLVLMSVDAKDVSLAQALGAAFIHKGGLPEEVLATLAAFTTAANSGVTYPVPPPHN